MICSKAIMIVESKPTIWLKQIRYLHENRTYLTLSDLRVGRTPLIIYFNKKPKEKYYYPDCKDVERVK